jgi:hypothetical protein
VINLLVLAYLVWLLQRKKQRVGGVVQSKA